MKLIDLPPMPQQFRVRNLKKPIWTKNKAKLIERYIYYFLQITHNCAYIDGFAGPQREEKSQRDDEMWSAKLVVEIRPRWIRRFYLFDKSKSQVKRIRRMTNDQPPRRKGEPKRHFVIKRGDVNIELPKLLAGRPITEKAAAFCLLDQRTFDCHWSTIEAVAKYKTEGLKIELFYFFPIGWLDRSLEALKNERKGGLWWGRPDWKSLRRMGSIARGELVAERFRKEFGYKHVHPWPIFQRQGGGKIMYFMVHASDHDDAPKLMWRAYHKAVDPLKPQEQQMKLVGNESGRESVDVIREERIEPKVLIRLGGADGARTRDLRRDRPAF
jgi:three-Cys-motif partner protein